jgi:hypothetical protein
MYGEECASGFACKGYTISLLKVRKISQLRSQFLYLESIYIQLKPSHGSSVRCILPHGILHCTEMPTCLVHNLNIPICSAS